jgi:hypothetical protein
VKDRPPRRHLLRSAASSGAALSPTIVSTHSSDTIPDRSTILLKPSAGLVGGFVETSSREGTKDGTLDKLTHAERCRMRLFTPLAVFVIAIITTQARTNAEDAPVPPEKLTTVSSTSTGACQQCSENGFDQYRQQADIGAPGSPGFGFKHFPFKMHMFASWHRPKAATLTRTQRCEADDPFLPRGYGHLFARPCDSFRMEYSPYVLDRPQSQYGPAYIYRTPDERCEDCNH